MRNKTLLTIIDIKQHNEQETVKNHFLQVNQKQRFPNSPLLRNQLFRLKLYITPIIKMS